MIRALLLPFALATATLAPVAVPAQGVFVPPPPSVVSPGPLRGQRADLARELPRYGYGDVDVRRLSNGQVAHIYYLLYSGRSEGDVRGQVGATLRGSVVQRGVDRALRQ